MDVEKALRELHEEKRRLDGAIAALEARLRNGSHAHVRRGRKSMSPAERLEVSRRMSKYWEARRAATGAVPVAPAVETEFQPKAAAASSLSA
jgi:hypothetical protein